ncbi:MBL fold metallo-hydrolase [Woeseia oceani]|uniref:beta-lactamase n=1 Tax=Woeseia oceani TaxID=1548547 RepID=A0A193LHV0_9GAMM|nr:MBL fold metallo-hydrolase [Woeseia oceani]ANO52076.1 NADPH-quinone reductase [Woeseia oceani]
MNHRTPAIFAAGLLLAVTAVAQDDIRFKSTELGTGLFMLEGVGGFSGGNLGLLTGDDGVVLIDDGLEPLAGKTLAAVQEVSGAPVDFVINTHVHGDHLGGNVALHQHGATIVAHDSIRQRLLDSDAARDALPELTFAEEVTFHLNNHKARVIHVEHAHTDGDAIIHFADANVIHTGDAMFNGLFPFIDLDSGGSVEGYIAAQNRVLEMADAETRIIPGHGPLANRGDLVRARDMLVDARDRIQALLDAGASAEEILSQNPLADYAGWSWDFITTERMTQQLVRGLSMGH